MWPLAPIRTLVLDSPHESAFLLKTIAPLGLGIEIMHAVNGKEEKAIDSQTHAWMVHLFLINLKLFHITFLPPFFPSVTENTDLSKSFRCDCWRWEGMGRISFPSPSLPTWLVFCACLLQLRQQGWDHLQCEGLT